MEILTLTGDPIILTDLPTQDCERRDYGCQGVSRAPRGGECYPGRCGKFNTLNQLTSEDRASPADSKGSLTGCFIGLGVGGRCPDMLANVGFVSGRAGAPWSALPNLGGIWR